MAFSAPRRDRVNAVMKTTDQYGATRDTTSYYQSEEVSMHELRSSLSSTGNRPFYVFPPFLNTRVQGEIQTQLDRFKRLNEQLERRLSKLGTREDTEAFTEQTKTIQLEAHALAKSLMESLSEFHKKSDTMSGQDRRILSRLFRAVEAEMTNLKEFQSRVSANFEFGELTVYNLFDR
jgi:hypothetical protein